MFEKTPLHSLRSEGIAKSIAESETHRDALHKSMSHRLTKLGGILRLDSWKTSSGRRGRGRKDLSDNGTPILDARFLPNLRTLPFARDLLGGRIAGRDISARKLAALFELPTQFEFW